MKTNLKAIRGHSSGIVIHRDGVVISYVWGNEDGIPMLSPLNIPVLAPLYQFELTEAEDVENCQSVLPETDEAYITEEEFDSLKGQAGKLFTLVADTGYVFKILHPETWR